MDDNTPTPKKVDKMIEEQGISPDQLTDSDKKELAEEIDS